MRESPYKPALHLFVCTNARGTEDPLGTGCGARGDAVYNTLKTAVRTRGLGASVWISRTRCLGICPASGCAVASYSERPELGKGLLTEVQEMDVDAILDKSRRV